MTTTRTEKSKYYVCTGDALVHLKSYDAELTKLKDSQQAIADEYTAKVEQNRDQYVSILRELWQRLNLLLGLEHEHTWQNPEYIVETRYLEDGFGAIIHEPIANPIADALGLAEEELSEAEKELAELEVPDKASMN